MQKLLNGRVFPASIEKCLHITLLFAQEIPQENVVKIKVDYTSLVDGRCPRQQVDLEFTGCCKKEFGASHGKFYIIICDRNNFCLNVHSNLLDVTVVSVVGTRLGAVRQLRSP